jgi:hypothetical protein
MACCLLGRTPAGQRDICHISCLLPERCCSTNHTRSDLPGTPDPPRSAGTPVRSSAVAQTIPRSPPQTPQTHASAPLHPCQRGDALVRSLRGSAVHRLAIELYQCHNSASAVVGDCELCGETLPCGPHRHATAVLLAAGDDPRRYNPPELVGLCHAQLHSEPNTREVGGYPVGGRSRLQSVPWFPHGR